MPQLAGGTNEDLLREIEARVDIVDIIGESVELTRRGNRYWGVCPFHSEKTPSFSVSQERQLFYCFGCHEGGNVFSFLAKHKKMDFRESVEYLAEKTGIDLSRYRSARQADKDNRGKHLLDINQEALRFYHELLKSDRGRRALAYVSERGINETYIEKFGLGYAPDDWRQLEEHLLKRGYQTELMVESGLIKRSQKEDLYIDALRNRIIFPIFNLSGRVIGFGGRIISGDGPKYLNSPETAVFSKRHNLYGLYHGRDAIRTLNEVILVEGYMDCLQLHQHGVENAVATLGTAFTREQAKLVKRLAESVIIMYDGDEAGQRETLRAIGILQEEALIPWIVSLPSGDDPDDFIRKYGKEEFLKFIQNNRCTVTEFKLDNLVKMSTNSSLESKIEILWSVFPDIARNESLMAQEKQLGMAARKLGLQERDVTREFSGWKKVRGASGSIRNRNLINRNNRKRNENTENTRFQEKLLAKMLKEPEYFDRIKKLCGLDFFTDSSLKKIAVEFDMVKNNASSQVSDWFNEVILKEPDLGSIWARLNLIEEEESLTEMDVDGFIRTQTALRQRSEWGRFTAEINNLETDGDFYSVLRCIIKLADLTYQGREGGNA